MDNVKNVGYHCWIDKNTIALFILPTPFTLQIANLKTEKTTILDDSIGRCIQKNCNKDIGSYFKKSSDSTGFIRKFDTYLMKTYPVKYPKIDLSPIKKSEDFVWYNENYGPENDPMIIMGAKSTLYNVAEAVGSKSIMDREINGPSFIIQDLSGFGIYNIGRIVLSPDKKKIAIVTTK